MNFSKINPEKIKKSIICKNISSTFVNKRIKKTYVPKAGDVAIFKVYEIGKHTRIQTEYGNNKHILPGDYIMAAFGNRYATDQMEGYVPTGYCSKYHILGQGGAIGVMKTMHEKYELIGPTSVTLVGYVVDQNGEILNTKTAIVSEITEKSVPLNYNPKIILSLGSSMESGKTTSAAFLTRGLTLARKKVAYIKLTGTVYTKDKSMVQDYGAKVVRDFSDYGFPSTYMCEKEELLSLYDKLLDDIQPYSPEYIIVEIADGLLQRETWELIHDKKIKDTVSGVLFSSGDSMSAISGGDTLSKLGYRVIGASGLFTTSPLLVQEVKKALAFGVLVGEQLMSKDIVGLLNKKLKTPDFESKMAVNL